MSITCIQGDALTVLRTFSDEQFHCCVTSPPYWGLRDYGTAIWEGGDPNCAHTVSRAIGSSTLRNDGRKNIGTQPHEKTAALTVPYRGNCLKCGATRVDSQIGLESTPDEYVAKMVEVFREVRRVLRKDGTLWLNLGDSYYNYRFGCQPKQTFHKNPSGDMVESPRRQTRQKDLKDKDLVGIPWRVAFALQADGWYLRSEIIWSKPNPMPESVTDRPTKSHEHLFLLAKSERYYYDAKAISEPSATADPSDPSYRVNGKSTSRNRVEIPGQTPHGLYFADKVVHPVGSYKWATEPPSSSGRRMVENVKAARAMGAAHDNPFGPMRNKRSVWTINTESFPEAHFAVFPEDLVRPCILAGCPQGGTVLDPFAGSGTTLLVAQELQCSAVGIDLNPAYVAMAQDRIAQEVFPFAPALEDTPDDEVMPLPPQPEQLTFEEEMAP